MRIISGLHKGRKINAPKRLPVRPTKDMAKEALFNILNHMYYFDELSVLDLFSGTGSISYEFASRGSSTITAVDQDLRCLHFINETAQQLEMPIETIKSDVFKYLSNTRQTYHIIFADPPYHFTDDQFGSIPSLVFANDLLKEGGLLIIEHSKHTDLSNLDQFQQVKHYGGSAFSFFA
ncbi:MAG: RsmD family RNA methyltransferase [Bacteroidia bacterium]|nr:RsmD family RNA methyltransferase [Bacteroidia bacterium]